MKKRAKKRDIDFLLANKHYKRLNLILYIISVSIITLVYFLTLLLFSGYVNTILTVITSLVVGLYLVWNRDKLVKKISSYQENKKREKYKQESQYNRSNALRRPTPKNKQFKLEIKSSLSEKAARLKTKLKEPKRPKKPQGYIEIK